MTKPRTEAPIVFMDLSWPSMPRLEPAQKPAKWTLECHHDCNPEARAPRGAGNHDRPGGGIPGPPGGRTTEVVNAMVITLLTADDCRRGVIMPTCHPPYPQDKHNDQVRHGPGHALDMPSF